MNTNLNKSEFSLHSKDPKKEFLDWLESLKISKYWLDTMSQSDSFALCKEIYQILQKLRKLDLLAKEKLSALIEIGSCLQGVYEKLHDSYLDGKLPLAKNQQEIVEIIIFSHLELANAYYTVIATNKVSREKLSQQHLALAACKGFQGLGVVFLTAAETYANPAKGFWLLCYQLFSASEELNLLDTKVKIDDAIYSAAVLFRRLLIFHIIDKKLLFPKEIEKIFDALLRGINYIQSYILAMLDVTNTTPGEIFGFSLHKDEPPSIQSNVTLATAKILRYVEKSEVIKIIQFLIREAKEQTFYSEKNQQQNSVNPELLSRILNTLDHQKSKRQTRITQELVCRAIVGIDNLVDVLLEKEGKQKLNSTNPQHNKIKDEFDDFEMSLDWESEKKTAHPTPVLERLKIINSSINGYGISWNSNTVGKLQVGEAIGIMADSNSAIKKIEIGLIRRIDVADENIFFGVELIGFESTLINLVRNKSELGEWLLFLFGSPSYDVGILCHKESYQTGEAVFVQLPDKKIPCSLGAIFNSTPVLDHIGLSY